MSCYLRTVGKVMTGPDLVDEYVSSALGLLRTRRRTPLTRSDVTAIIHDLRSAVGVLSDIREALPEEG